MKLGKGLNDGLPRTIQEEKWHKFWPTTILPLTSVVRIRAERVVKGAVINPSCNVIPVEGMAEGEIEIKFLVGVPNLEMLPELEKVLPETITRYLAQRPAPDRKKWFVELEFVLNQPDEEKGSES